jgi:ketosteroid isomerase-like protein
MLRERLKAAALCIPLIAFTASAVNESLARPHPNDAAVRAFIEHFFTAFDARDFEAIEHSFAPGAKIVHDNGASTTALDLKRMLQSAKQWPARKRELSNFEIVWEGNVAVVGYLNHVTFEEKNGGESVFNETSVLVWTPQGFRTLRAHYSRVAPEVHLDDGK